MDLALENSSSNHLINIIDRKARNKSFVTINKIAAPLFSLTFVGKNQTIFRPHYKAENILLIRYV